MLQEFFHKKKRQHRRVVLTVGLFILLFLTLFVAGTFGMEPAGYVVIMILFVIMGMLMELTFDHHS